MITVTGESIREVRGQLGERDYVLKVRLRDKKLDYKNIACGPTAQKGCIVEALNDEEVPLVFETAAEAVTFIAVLLRTYDERAEQANHYRAQFTGER
jgi:hypothetical protein